jgi:hypothetical protein
MIDSLRLREAKRPGAKGVDRNRNGFVTDFRTRVVSPRPAQPAEITSIVFKSPFRLAPQTPL